MDSAHFFGGVSNLAAEHLGVIRGGISKDSGCLALPVSTKKTEEKESD